MHASRRDHAFYTASQTDDLHCFILREFHNKRVAGVQKLTAVGDLLTVVSKPGVRAKSVNLE
jgi:hypothetical protein